MKSLIELPGCVVEKVSEADSVVVIEARKRCKYECCPDCGCRSCSVHSRYVRSPDDLPICWQGTQLRLKVRRFRCPNPSCNRCTFAERFPELVIAHAQRTERLKNIHTAVGMRVGGEGGAELLELLKMPISPDTLLRSIKSTPDPEYKTPRILGVDDWSFKRGKTYGTILVDLDKHQVVDLLADRSVDTLTAWLKKHPGVEIISRDRSTDYARAASEGAPTAIQVADRWHLLKNLGDVLKQWLERHRGALGRVAQTLAPTTKTILFTEKARNNKALFEQALDLTQQGFSIQATARKLGLPRRTLGRWLKQGNITKRKDIRSHLAEYTPYLKQRYAEGMTNILQLHREIVTKGFAGSYASLYLYFAALEAGHGEEWSYTVKNKNVTYSLFEKQLIFSNLPDKLNQEQKNWLKEALKDIPQASTVYDSVQGFAALVRKTVADPITGLKEWLKSAEESGIQELKRFANGIQLDLAAVEAALTQPWSNGQTEGWVNKLKLIKRTMFGRAKFDLLRKRVLLL
jgi:transposase